jgi:DNA polymerase-3 subunit delta
VPAGRGEASRDPLAALERGALRAYYLLYGDETFLVDRGLRVLRDRLVPAGRPGTWRTLWGDEQAGEVAGAIEELGSPSLFGGPQVLVVRHADGLPEETKDRVLEMLPGLGAGGTLVLVARAADQRRRLFAACLRAGAGFGFQPLADRRAVETWVVRLAREDGRDIAPAAVHELIERSGPDLGVLAGEIVKLGLHAGPGARIELRHVRELVAAVRAHDVEELTARLARRELPGAARVLRQLLAEGEPPIRLVAFLAANLRRALHVEELAQEGIGAEEIARRLGMPAWMVGRNLGRGRVEDLLRSLLVLRRLDLALKSGRDADAAFDAALLEIAGA